MNLPQPSNREAEATVIGSLLLDNSQLDDVRDILPLDAFHAESHRLIYGVILDLDRDGVPADLVTVKDRLGRAGTLERAGGTAYLIGLQDDVPAAVFAPHYARIVARDHARRLHANAGAAVVRLVAQEPDLSPDELHARALDAIAAARPAGTTASLVSIASALDEARAARILRASGMRPAGSVTTGLRDLDRLIVSLDPGDLAILAARPSVGKSALALGIAVHVALEGGNVLYQSLEMPARALAERAACALARVDLARLKAPHGLGPHDLARYANAETRLAGAPIHFDHRGTATVADVRANARRIRAGLVVVDYMQLLTGTAGKSGNRQEEVASLSRGLKALAVDLGIPVLALSQLNRNLEGRPNKRPVLSDLRESGQIEQDADVIAFLHREETHDPMTDRRGVAEVIVGKQRNGPLGTVELQWHAPHLNFRDLTTEYA